MPFAIDEILLHRPPMVMVDRLIEHTATTALAEKTFHGESYGVSKGLVAEAALIESMAQTVAALQGQLAREKGVEPRSGMLVGIQDLAIHGRLKAGERALIEIEIRRQLGAFCFAFGRVTHEGTELVSGVLKFFFTDEAPESARGEDGSAASEVS